MSNSFLFKSKRTIADFFFVCVFLLSFLFLSDYLIASRFVFSNKIWALYDGFVHGLVGAVILFPIYKNNRKIVWAILFLLSALIDIDHFLVIRSFSLTEALQLPIRPLSHSVTFAAFAGCIGYGFTRDKILYWTLFTAITSHVIRDACGGATPILWPLAIYRVPSWLYYGGEIILLALSFKISMKYLLRPVGGRSMLEDESCPGT